MIEVNGQSEDDYLDACVQDLLDSGEADDEDEALEMCSLEFAAQSNTMATLRLQCESQLRAASSGPQRRFACAPAYSGGVIPGYTLSPPSHDGYVIDLASMTQRNDRIVANLDHRPEARVGHITQVVNDGRQLTLLGVVSARTQHAREFVQSLDSSFPWSVSIECSSRAPRPERNVVVNGRHYDSVNVIRGAQLTGVAMVSAGADESARAIAASASRSGNSFRGGSNMVSANEAAKIIARAESVELKCSGAFANRLTEAKERALAGRLDSLQFEREVEAICAADGELHSLRASRPQAGQFSAVAGQGGFGDIETISAALCLNASMPNIEKHFSARTLEQAYGARKHVSLHQLLMRAAVQNGYDAAPGEYIHSGNLRGILRAAFSPNMRAGGLSTIALPDILGNVANKNLTDGFIETSGDEWRQIADVKSVNNFHAASFYRMLEDSEYELVGPGGNIPHGTLAESKMSVQAQTFGRMFGVSRQDIINDNLGALADLPRRIGRGSGMKFRRVFWSAFLADDGFWDPSNGNVLTGAGTALAADGAALATALVRFRQMRTSEADGKKLIGGKPATLMVPPELELTARPLLNSSTVVAGGSADVSIVSGGNPFSGTVDELVVADWLSDSDLVGYSAAQWYLLRNPALAPAMLVAFLNGQQAPTVETAEADFNTLGVEYRGYHDFGCGRGEPLCGLQVAGTPSS
jgi:hypothetical protein